MHRLVWDTSALLNIKEPDVRGYSPGHSLWKDLSDGWIRGPYQNILPAIAYFELQASISRKLREGNRVLREFYLLGENEIVYPIDPALSQKACGLLAQDGFDKLRGADLIFACIACIENAALVTLDTGFKSVAGKIKVIDLNGSRDSPHYRGLFQPNA